MWRVSDTVEDEWSGSRTFQVRLHPFPVVDNQSIQSMK